MIDAILPAPAPTPPTTLGESGDSEFSVFSAILSALTGEVLSDHAISSEDGRPRRPDRARPR